MSEKPVSDMNEEELLRWFEQRRKQPLFIASEEIEGMSLSYVNPAIVEVVGQEELEKNGRLVKKDEPSCPTAAE